MKSSLTVQDVLDDIEFELAQGTLSRNELGQSIRAVKQYQLKLRSESLRAKQPTIDLHEIEMRQFQINDMHLTLLQEMAAAIQVMQLDLRRTARLSRFASTITSEQNAAEANFLSNTPDLQSRDALDQSVEWWQGEDIDQMMHSEVLRQEIEVRSMRLPIIGSMLTRLRTALHSLVLFYANILAERQTKVNQVYGERIIQLSRLHQMQSEQLEMIKVQLAGLAGHSSEAKSPVDNQPSS